MADDQQDINKETVRINLPPGLTGKSSPVPPPSQSATTKIRIGPTEGTSPVDDAKRETSVLEKTTVVPKPKADTAKVNVSSAKPITPEMPRPTVKLRRDPEPTPSPSISARSSTPAEPVATESSLSGVDIALNIVAMVMSLAVLAYLATVA